MKLENIKKKTLKDLNMKSENEIQNEIIQYCKQIGGLAIVVPNELARNNRSVKITVGCSDLIIVLNGKILFVEMKNEKGIQSIEQSKFEAKIKDLGFEYFICRSLNQFKEIIK